MRSSSYCFSTNNDKYHRPYNLFPIHATISVTATTEIDETETVSTTLTVETIQTDTAATTLYIPTSTAIACSGPNPTFALQIKFPNDPTNGYINPNNNDAIFSHVYGNVSGHVLFISNLDPESTGGTVFVNPNTALRERDF
jgi:hypothetical protein